MMKKIEKQWKMMNKGEKDKKKWWKRVKKTINHNENERKTLKNDEKTGAKNNEKWWPREEKTRNTYEKSDKKWNMMKKTKKQWTMMKKRDTKTMKNY